MTDSKYRGRGGGDRENEGWEGDGKVGCQAFFSQHSICNYSNFTNCPKMYFIPVFLYFPFEDPVSVHTLHLIVNL